VDVCIYIGRLAFISLTSISFPIAEYMRSDCDMSIIISTGWANKQLFLLGTLRARLLLFRWYLIPGSSGTSRYHHVYNVAMQCSDMFDSRGVMVSCTAYDTRMVCQDTSVNYLDIQYLTCVARARACTSFSKCIKSFHLRAKTHGRVLTLFVALQSVCDEC